MSPMPMSQYTVFKLQEMIPCTKTLPIDFRPDSTSAHAGAHLQRAARLQGAHLEIEAPRLNSFSVRPDLPIQQTVTV